MIPSGLAAFIAREIRSSLSLMSMNLQILFDKLQPEDDILEHFEIAFRELDHIGEVLSSILTVSQVDGKDNISNSSRSQIIKS